jgi:hypothetical protein
MVAEQHLPSSDATSTSEEEQVYLSTWAESLRPCLLLRKRQKLHYTCPVPSDNLPLWSPPYGKESHGEEKGWRLFRENFLKIYLEK